MSSEFSPTSSNPRTRRAFAHAKLSQALRSGKPEDKLGAVEAANVASKTAKGKGLGMQAIRALVNEHNNNPGPQLPIRTNVDSEHGGGFSGWVEDDWVHRLGVIGEAFDRPLGITITRPSNTVGYIEAAHKVNAAVGINESASYAQGQQLGVETVDWSVPGTLHAHDVAHLLARDTSRRK